MSDLSSRPAPDNRDPQSTDRDPDRPLPGAPDPWEPSRVPPPRSGPPYAMTEMIDAEPALAERLLGLLAKADGPAGELAAAIAATARSGDPVVVTGCGTSEHGALGMVEILRDAMRRAGLPTAPGSPVALQALEMALDAPVRGLAIGVSHEGGTSATNAALAAARANGVRTAIVTVSARSPGAALADIVVATGEMDQSWCHTIAYLAPLLVATAAAGQLTGDPVDALAARALLASGLADPGAAEAIAASFVHARSIVVLGSGADRTAARELVLKMEEGAWIPSAMRDLETFLHGHLPSTDERTGLVLVLADRERRAERLARARQALEAARVVGVRAAAIVARDVDAQLDPELTPAGRLLVDEAPALPPPVAALLGTTTALQLLTERLARACGTNPDPIRHDDDRYRRAADAAG